MLLFFYGPNTYAARARIRELVNRYEAANPGGLGIDRFDGQENTEIDRIVAAMTALAFLANNRLVIIEDLLASPTLAEAVVSASKRIPPDNVVVVYERKVDERTKQFKALVSAAKTVKFDALGPTQLASWLKKQTVKLGINIDGSTLNYLVERVGTDQWRLASELEKLASYKSKITPVEINELVEPSFQATIFDLVNALSRSQTASALKLYDGLRAIKTPALQILAMIGWQIRNLLIASASKVASPPVSAQAIASDFKLNPFVVTKSLTSAQHWDLNRAQSAQRAVLETDYRIKTSSLDPDYLIRQLLIELGTN